MWRKFFWQLIFFCGIFVFSSQAVWAESITAYDVSIQIEKSGKIHVSEKIDYDFGQEDRHGIFRNIPFTKTNTDGKLYRFGVENIAVTDENGTPYIFEKTDENGEIVLKIGDPNSTISGMHTYLITYTVSGAMAYFSDHDELYWNAIGTGWDIPVEKGSVSVRFPQEIGAEYVRATCYTGSFESTQSQCAPAITADTIVFTLDHALSENEGFTIVVGFPKGIVAQLEPTLVVSFWDTVLGKIVIVGIIIVSIFWYLLLPLFIAYKWYTAGRDPHVGPAPTAYFDPPQNKTGHKLTPAETAGLYDEVVDNKDITATYIDLARRGFFTIVEKKKGEFTLVRQSGKTEKNDSLSDFERVLFEGTFVGEDEVELAKASLVTPFAKAKEKVYERLVSAGFFDKNPDKTRTVYILIGTFALISANPLLAFASFVFGRHMPKKTLLGAREKNKAAGLLNFLKSQEKHFAFEKGVDRQVLFEKLLPYAVAFGVEKEWLKHFAATQIVQPSWYAAYGHSATFSSDAFSRSLSSLGAKASSAATPTSSSKGFSSGFSGGFSGGGGGGGGGGSW